MLPFQWNFCLLEKRLIQTDPQILLKTYDFSLIRSRQSPFKCMQTLVLAFFSIKDKGGKMYKIIKRCAKVEQCQERHYYKIPVRAEQIVCINKYISKWPKEPFLENRNFDLADQTFSNTKTKVASAMQICPLGSGLWWRLLPHKYFQDPFIFSLPLKMWKFWNWNTVLVSGVKSQRGLVPKQVCC